MVNTVSNNSRYWYAYTNSKELLNYINNGRLKGEDSSDVFNLSITTAVRIRHMLFSKHREIQQSVEDFMCTELPAKVV